MGTQYEDFFRLSLSKLTKTFNVFRCSLIFCVYKKRFLGPFNFGSCEYNTNSVSLFANVENILKHEILFDKAA